MSNLIQFTVLGRPEPQGSIRAFVVKGRPRLTSDNAKMKPWRQQVGQMALSARSEAGCNEIWAARHQPVGITYVFCLAKPKSAKKSRTSPAVKPDLDKLIRSASDALTGILFDDDGQVVQVGASKIYGSPERTEISVWRFV